MSLLLRKVGRDDKMMNVEGKEEEKTSKRARVHEVGAADQSLKTKKRKKDKVNAHVVNFKEMDAEAQ